MNDKKKQNLEDNIQNLEDTLKCLFSYEFFNGDVCLQPSRSCSYIKESNWEGSEVYLCSKYRVEADYSSEEKILYK